MELQCQMLNRPLPQLPQELVTRVLRNVDQQQRLGSCSLVCRAWQEAAAAASNDVRLLHPISVSRVKGLGQWLLQPGVAAVTQLVVLNRYGAAAAPRVLQLPAAQLERLQKLQVYGCDILMQADARSLHQVQPQADMHSHASSSSGSSSIQSQQVLSGFSGLTSLVLEEVRVRGPAGLGGLSALTGLQELQLIRIRTAGKTIAMRPTEALQLVQEQQLRQDILLGLRSLTQLTRLVISDWLLPKWVAAPFSCLQKLQELTLPGVFYTSSTVQQLPLSLTKLVLECGAEEEVHSSLSRDLAALTNLQQLDVCSHSDQDDAPGMLPDFCSSMQQLRVLKLHGILSADALPALVLLLPELLYLEDLTICNERGELAPLPANDVAGYSALLPLSQHITRIELSWRGDMYIEEASILHAGCGQHLFAAGRQLPQLKQLVLGVPAEESPWVHGAAKYENKVYHRRPFLGEGSTARLVSCCPGLEQLHIAGMVEPGVDMRPLLQLTALVELCIGGDVVSDEVARDVLAQLSSLQRLGVFVAAHFTDHGLLALTALRQLTQLAVGRRCGISEEVKTNYGGFLGTHVLELKQKDSLPPGWLQLLSRCERSKSCGKLALEQLKAL